MMRFKVSGHSMQPTLSPGDEVVATTTSRPAVGDIVAFPDPAERDQWLIKRLAAPGGIVSSDNRSDSARDSSQLGPIDEATMLKVIDRLDQATFLEACDLLAAEDDAIGSIIEHHGAPDFWHRDPGFATLVLLILEQQVSLESGAAVYRRLASLVDLVSPEALIELGDSAMRTTGVTRQKSSYILGLAESVTSGELDLEALSAVPVTEAQTTLVSIRGIGPWTADAYLLSAERRPDMWPVGDRALQVGAAEMLGMSEIPDASQLEILGQPWRPLRAVAARLIWHGYLVRRGREEPSDLSN